eukprot:14184-Heterococcus_DN1.PRE.2
MRAFCSLDLPALISCCTHYTALLQCDTHLLQCDTHSFAVQTQVKPELLELIANLDDDQQSQLFEQYRSIRRNSAPSSPRRGGLAAVHSTRGSSSQTARLNISTMCTYGQKALDCTNSDDDERSATQLITYSLQRLVLYCSSSSKASAVLHIASSLVHAHLHLQAAI